ncbi:site-specific DNA-methyltransferase [Bradyrhizobium sp. McL0616]|uniref:site-specific DNA-methyltransferase n=1 Tax=Bradyrhizobium sp. McL0616 TaxID=3415674 RepID=UPI003CF72A81
MDDYLFRGTPFGSNAELTKFTSGRAILQCLVSDLQPHPSNARQHSKAQIRAIAKSIATFGFNAPILANKDLQVLAGHGRCEAAKLLGLTHVPVILLDHLTDTQAKAYMLADNKLTDRSSWDEPRLAIQLKELADLALEFDIEATGFEAPEIDFRIQSLEESVDEDDGLFIAQGPSVSKQGDLWHLGDHRVFCGNSLEEESYVTLGAGLQADMVFTDPPYNVKIDGNAAGHGKTSYREFAMAVGEMSDGEFTGFLTTALSNASSSVTKGGIIYACMDWRHMEQILAAGRASKLELMNLCVWVKPNGRLGSFYKSRHELVFVYKNGNESHRNNIQLGRFGRNRTNVWNYSSPSPLKAEAARSAEMPATHPTIKPVQMVSDAILDCTDRNSIVLDPFLGSGTTLMAAERTGRRCYGIELDPLYVDGAITRWHARLENEQSALLARHSSS